MNKWKISSQMEESVVQAFGVPEIRSEFIEQVYDDLMCLANTKKVRATSKLHLRPAWVVTFAILVAAVITILSIGPGRVYAAFQRLLGYIPGVGIVEQDDHLRLLSQPVQVTQDGITVSVNQALLTGSVTTLDFGISGVPLSSYPKKEAVSGCMEREYLLLPDGSRIEATDPIPPDIYEATFILPCIFNTLPGSAPIDWELPLKFMDAPDDLTILPVIPVATATMVSESTRSAVSSEDHPEILPTKAAPSAQVTVDQIIETEEGYILLGAVRPSIGEGDWLQITGAAIIRDASGNKISYTFPEDIQPLDDLVPLQGGYAWVMEIKGAGLQFPLTIGFSGVVISQVAPDAAARITVDVGAAPQPGQTWELNREIQLAGYTITLVSLTAHADGYSFLIDPGSDLSRVSVQIEGHQAMGGGGGGGTQAGAFTTSMIFESLPTGELTLLFDKPTATSPTETWQVEWQPDVLPTYPAEEMTDNAGVCWNTTTFPTIPVLPDGLDGSVIFTQLNPQIQIVMAHFDSSDSQAITTGSGRAAITWDGSDLAYVDEAGITIRNLAADETTQLPGISGRDLYWSPDKNRIALVTSGETYGILVIDRDGGNVTQLSNLGYESIAGWSPDGSTLFYAIPGASDDGFLLRSVNVQTGDTADLFVLENSSLKAPFPAVSPDGEWIAYRARDNNSVYLMRMDGSEIRLLLDMPAVAVTGIVWEAEGHLLGISLITDTSPEGSMILMAPDSCETYLLPGLYGTLDGILIP